jgi:hypothetical protein
MTIRGHQKQPFSRIFAREPQRARHADAWKMCMISVVVLTLEQRHKSGKTDELTHLLHRQKTGCLTLLYRRGRGSRGSTKEVVSCASRN